MIVMLLAHDRGHLAADADAYTAKLGHSLRGPIEGLGENSTGTPLA